MAADIRTRLILELSRKRQRLSHAPKLLLNEEVEVRSVEEGLRGSWHQGIVIECRTQIRVVKYHHLLCENTSENLIEFIPVLFAVDGNIPTNWRPSDFPNYRGKIRPVPPHFICDKIYLHYGQCVDAFHEDAWWEGVVFDHDDGSDERLIFFPDMGDELKAHFKNLRVTQDWDASTDEWKLRGDWIFLEVIEELKMEFPLIVSVKQIWYELQMTKHFLKEMKEWTCPVKESWKESVKEVMLDNFKLTMDDYFHRLTFPEDESLKTTHVLRSSKRARKDVSRMFQTPRTILSWLIDNNVVLPRAKVWYICKKDGCTMKEGRITRDGIKCSCCNCTFSVSKFQSHCGSIYGQGFSNIFLEDGRSLLDCQLQIKDQNERLDIKGNESEIVNDNDYICSVCQYGGKLVLCDECPSSFHTSCVGLKEVPDGEWFCPSCCCKICNQNGISESYERNSDNNMLNCEQCDNRYHVGCLKRRGILEVETYLEANWFCSSRCEEIFMGLERLLGKSIPVGRDNLTWTLRKNKTVECSNYESSNMEVIENYSKLNVAIGVMHECFEPVKESRNERDIVEDVIFCRRSKLRRLNFKGFYTVLLEKDDELISTATLRVYGEKVAEIPLVGTRFQYRRRGMCHILMHKLEKILTELGVKRLVLPAVSSALHTWTQSFGFSVMTESEKLNFLGCTFLDFQGTTMCHKLLVKPCSSGNNDGMNHTEPRSATNLQLKCYQRRKFKCLSESKCVKICK